MRGFVAPRARPGQLTITTLDLLEETAISQYALRANLHLQHIKPVWRDLWKHVASHLLAGKVRVWLLSTLPNRTVGWNRNLERVQGVLLPSLGSILLQPSGVSGQQLFVPVLHSATSLGARFTGESQDAKPSLATQCIRVWMHLYASCICHTNRFLNIDNCRCK